LTKLINILKGNKIDGENLSMVDMAFGDKSRSLLEYFESVDGMMTVNAAAGFLAVFQEMRRCGSRGHWFETGVYKGKSATLLCGSAADDEDVVLIDVGYHDTWDHLNALHGSIISIVSESETVEYAFPSIKNTMEKQWFCIQTAVIFMTMSIVI
jgi:hypothetical protein